MAREPVAPFVVLKFGGTSVAVASGWRNIADRIAERIDDGETPVVVHSALAGVSNDLEAILAASLRNEQRPVLEKIRAQHMQLAEALGLDGPALLSDDFAVLERLTSGIALIGEASPRQQARVLALGELMSSRLGHAFLRAQDLPLETVDARELLRSRSEPDEPVRHYLAAECECGPSEAVRDRLSAGKAWLTQGFIARDEQGHTVVLGRGGSDTSASYIAALIGARRIEIWTDVAGMYSADPRLVPEARLLKRLDYAEAQEIATTGAKVLHPRCLRPARAHRIPLCVRSTAQPAATGTLVSEEPGSTVPRLKAISARKALTLVSMESSGMWQAPGFLARAFAVFARRALSIDLVSSSETSVTVSLDAPSQTLADGTLDRLVSELSGFCTVRVLDRCAAISLVGRQVRAILHEVAPAFEVFKEYEVYLVSQAANDLNFTFVVDEKHADRLVQKLHDLLIRKGAEDDVLGASWAESNASASAETRSVSPPWWRERRDELLALAPEDAPLYVYDANTVRQAARGLAGLRSVSRIFYSAKANSHPDVLRVLNEEGLSFECVSRFELDHLHDVLPKLDPSRLLFTPNFAPRAEYAHALSRGVRVTIDNHFVLEEWPALFDGAELILRVDPGHGQGHHRYVQTAGKNSKFGIPLHDLPSALAAAERAGARITGLHAHKGSGIVDAGAWARTARTLADAGRALADVKTLNLGGGLGVPDTSAGAALDLAALDESLAEVLADDPQFELWLEPGRFLVAQSGAILARVTQCKNKDGIEYVGLNAGMHTLLRPALYGAWHEIVNLTRIDEAPAGLVDVVGPICESADVLGSARLMPKTREGDVVLIANAGAYGRVMSNRYNMRPPGDEILI